MFKDYYLILGVGSDASPDEIEKAYKDADAKINVRGIISKDFHDIQEAFTILSKPDIRALYDKELEKYNASGDYENYKIQDAKLEDTISSLQVNISKNAEDPSGCGYKLGKGCFWIFVVVILFMLQTCFSAIMKQKGRNAARNGYSYVIPQNK